MGSLDPSVTQPNPAGSHAGLQAHSVVERLPSRVEADEP